MRALAKLRISALLLLLAAPGQAQSERVIDAARIRLGDVFPEAPGVVHDVDLGPAPAPGNSRLLSRQEIERQLRDAGRSPSVLRVPASIRVTSAAKRWTVAELETLVEPAIERALPRGARLSKIRVRKGYALSPRAEVGRVTIGKLPKREGSYQTTAMVELVTDRETSVRLPVSVELELGSLATQSVLEKGGTVHLVIERGAARVSAVGIALAAGDVGDVVQFKVQNTHKVLRGRIESRTTAKVVGN
jgi:hypothetical protein